MNRRILKYNFNKLTIITELLFVLFISVFGFHYLSDFQNFTDISLYDESNYLFQGVNLIRCGLPNAEAAPLYAIWYYILSIFQLDNVKLYYLNFQIISILLPIVIYLVLRRCRVAIIPALLISIFFLVCFANFTVVPKVSHFALIVILSSFIVASFFKSYLNRLTVVLIGSLLSSYIRPELFISFILFCLIYGFVIIISYKKYNLRNFINFSFTILFLSINLLLVGIPISSGNRSFVAFSQHFALNWVNWENSKLSPWTNSQEIMHMNFGDAKTIPESIRNNPYVFFKHIKQNWSIFPNAVNEQITHSTLFFPSTTTYRRLELLFLSLIIVLYGIFKIYSQKTDVFSLLKNNFNERRESWLFIFIYIIPVFISIIIIYPEEHYLTVLIVLLLIFATTIIIIPDKVVNRQASIIFIILFSLISLVNSTNVANLKYFSRHKPNITVINYLLSLKISERVNLLEARGGFNIYLGSNFNRIAEYEKDSDFMTFMNQKKINMILIDANLQSYNRLINDVEWQYFLKNFAQYGFIKKNIPDSGTEVLIHKTLL